MECGAGVRCGSRWMPLRACRTEGPCVHAARKLPCCTHRKRKLVLSTDSLPCGCRYAGGGQRGELHTCMQGLQQQLLADMQPSAYVGLMFTCPPHPHPPLAIRWCMTHVCMHSRPALRRAQLRIQQTACLAKSAAVPRRLHVQHLDSRRDVRVSACVCGVTHSNADVRHRRQLPPGAACTNRAQGERRRRMRARASQRL